MIKLLFETYSLINLSHYRKVLRYKIEHPKVLVLANKSEPVSEKTKELGDEAFSILLATYDAD